MDQALDLMRRLPPDNVQENLSALVDLAPELTEELLCRVDQPLQVTFDNIAQKDFLLCDYNRDGDSYRSPWSNTYFPALEDGALPSPALRQLEAEANEVFNMYRDQYFEGGTSSVYLWDLQGGFAGCFLINKAGSDGKHNVLADGFWDSIHVVEVLLSAEGKMGTYKLTSTVMLSLVTKIGIQMGGSLTRQIEETAAVSEGHITNIGQMIEEMEGKLRNSLDQVYFGKTREVVCALRTPVDDTLEIRADSQRGINLQANLISEMLAKNKRAADAIKPSNVSD